MEMKRTVILTVLIALVFLISSCASMPVTNQENSPPKIDYYEVFKDCFTEFQLWERELSPVNDVYITTLKPKEEFSDLHLPKYKMIGSATMLAKNTGRKNGMIAGRIFAQKGAHLVIIYGIDKEEEQKGKATTVGLGSAGSGFGGSGGAGGVLGYARRSESVWFSGKRIGQIMAFRFLEIDVKEWQARLARKEAEKAAREVPLVKEEMTLMEVPLVEAKKVAETKVMPPPVVVYFPFDSAKILPKEHYKLIEIADWLAKHPKYRIQIEGHACPIGSEDYNAVLARKRALAGAMGIVDILEKPPYNIPTNQIMPDLIAQYVSVGEDKLVVQSTTIEGGKPNRRFEIRIVISPSSGEIARGGQK